MSSSGGEAVRVTRNAKVAGGLYASTDGKVLYYDTGDITALSVWSLPVEGGEGTKIFGPFAVHPRGRWTIGAEGIYFITAPDIQGHRDLSVHEFATNKTRKIVTIERSIFWGLALSPECRTILYSQIDQVESDLMLLENFK